MTIGIGIEYQPDALNKYALVLTLRNQERTVDVQYFGPSWCIYPQENDERSVLKGST